MKQRLKPERVLNSPLRIDKPVTAVLGEHDDQRTERHLVDEPQSSTKQTENKEDSGDEGSDKPTREASES